MEVHSTHATNSRTTPMRWPTSARHVDVNMVEERRAEWRFASIADRQAFEALPEHEQLELRRGFDATVHALVER